MSARQALLRIVANGIAKGHAHGIDPAHVSNFLNQLQEDSPEIIVAAGLQKTGSLDQDQKVRPARRSIHSRLSGKLSTEV